MKSRLLRTSLDVMTLLAMSSGLVQAQGGRPASYTVTDIGTLGGVNSFAYAINSSGMVAGGANTPGRNSLFA